MKNFLYVCLILVSISCVDEGPGQAEIIMNNPYLIGQWEGTGGFLDRNTAKKLGDIRLEFSITEDFQISGSIGDTKLEQITLIEANYGYAIKGILESKLKEGVDFEKDHVIILLVIPEDSESVINSIDANFHLKSNFIFDFGMRVGGVYLTKIE